MPPDPLSEQPISPLERIKSYIKEANQNKKLREDSPLPFRSVLIPDYTQMIMTDKCMEEEIAAKITPLIKELKELTKETIIRLG